MLKHIALAATALALVTGVPLTASAQDAAIRQLTYLTFSAPIQMPGFELPAGTYRFSLADPDTSREVVEVDSQDGKKTYGLFLTIPNERMKQSGDTVVLFRESPAGEPPALRAWFYPDERTGYEIVYPRNQAAKIAKVTHERVLASDAVTGTSSDAERVKAIHHAKVGHVDENGDFADDAAATSGSSDDSKAVGNDHRDK